MSGTDYSTSITRSLTRLKSIFITFSGYPFGDKTSNTLPISGQEMRKWWNDFYHPAWEDVGLQSKNEIEVQVSIGSKQFPEYPLKSCAESFYQLRKTLGIC